MAVDKFTSFEKILINNGNHTGSSVLLLLAWIAASDGRIDQREQRRLNEIAAASKHSNDVQELLSIAVSRDIRAIGLASQILSRHFDANRSELFMQMAIGMAIADGYLITTENYILRYLADIFGINKALLQKIFKDVTGKVLPEPKDPSSYQYWENSSGGASDNEQSQEDDSEQTKRSSNSTSSSKYFGVLGLEPGASKEEIRKAYRRLAQIHHPDRFHSLGEEAVAAATNTFQRIKEAYDYLVKYA